jgi:transcriptional regulator with XRE-family HTH domain
MTSESTTGGDAELPWGSQEVERLDVAGLADLVRRRRGSMSLRQTAADIGVSFSTLTRVEGGSQPDLTSFTKICAWLGVAPSHFFTPVAQRQQNPVEEFVHHLHQDPRLTDKSAAIIADMLSEMYARLAIDTAPTRPLLACHLRAASTLRPGVPERLASLLGDMNTALEKKVQAGTL